MSSMEKTRCRIKVFTSSDTTSLSMSNSLRSVADLYGYYTGLFNLSVGLLGNTLMILLFTNVKVFQANQCSFYFIVESFSNLGLLLTIYSSRIFHAIFGYDLALANLAWCKIRLCLAQIFGLCSLFTICLSTFDQYLSTNHRYSFRQLSSLKLAHRLIFLIGCFVVTHSLLFLLYAEIRPTLGCTVYDALVNKYYSFFYYPIVSTALPFLVTITFSLLAYHNVRRIVRRQVPVVRRRLDRQMTTLVLTRVICIVICGLPYICVTLYGLNNSSSNAVQQSILALIGAILYSLLYTNFCINFYIFLLVSSRFRRQVKHFLCKQCCQSLKAHWVTRRTVLNHNRVAPHRAGRPIIPIIESIS